MRSTIAFSILATLATVTFAHTCFPYGGATLPIDLSAPNVTLEEWWCSQSMAYGFQGFSYPMENSNCSAIENSFDWIDADFAKMKHDFGASVVRLYYVLCIEAVVFENIIRAAAKNNMAVIFQVWTNFGEGDLWKTSQQAIFDALDNEKYTNIAPYVVHWADFGSEPVGDGMDGGAEQFVADLGNFRQNMHNRGILAGISEDWDSPGILSNTKGSGLGLVGEGVRANSDYAHIHPMPFYHFDDLASEAWYYIEQQTLWVKRHVRLPVMITESQWAWGENDHDAAKKDVSVASYNAFWKAFDDHCEWFKEQTVGWFLHAWSGESTFDIMYPNGTYIIPQWRPRRC